MTREPLSARRYNESSDFVHQGIRYDMQVGVYEDGRVGEVFVQMEKAAGTLADVNARDTAILISMALQHGIPLERMHLAMTKDADGRSEGFAGAVIDHLLQWEPIRGGWGHASVGDSSAPQGEPAPGPAITAENARGFGFSGDQCTSCNSMRMKVAGHCLVCDDCGTTTGCS